ncbi:MAG: DinB family protein [Leptospiraceae bacterium]|nr:DinB family protein [Leptospiraceae bacterium]
MKFSDPYTKEELIDSVQRIKTNFETVIQNMPDTDFFKRPETGWSPAENFQHIIKVTRLLSLSFSAPKFLASLVFGEVTNSAPRIHQVADVYLDALKKGQNSGPFTPSKESIEGDSPKRKLELLSDWNKSWDKYGLAVKDWNEEQLDKILMPHPFLGKIPAREMYMIGILHPIHHLEIVAKRLGKEWNYF